MPFAFTISAVIPASPRQIYDAWLDSVGHAQMTATNSAKGSTEVGGAIEAWNGYISGRNLTLEPGERIVQAWRTTEFSDADSDSQIDLTFERASGGTKVTLTHSNVPDGHTGYQSGWVTHYFEPMTHYFSAAATPAEMPMRKAKPAAKPKPARKAAAKAKPKTKAAAKPKAKPQPKAKAAAKAKPKAKTAKVKAKAAKKPVRKAKAAPPKKAKTTAKKKPAKKKARR